MADTRSPRYPNISLADAISKARLVYEKEHLSALTPGVAAEAMGYKGLNGASLKVISSLRKYGLLDGRGDEVRITKDAQTLIIDDPKSPDYHKALLRTALNPEIFTELRRQYPGKASERNISVYLEKSGFKPDAAELTAKNYLETMTLVEGLDGLYDSQDEKSEPATAMKSDTHVSSGPSVSNVNAGQSSGTAIGLPTPLPVGVGLPPMRVVQHGDRLEIQAVVDLSGLRKLKRVLNNYEQILIMMVGDPDVDLNKGDQPEE